MLPKTHQASISDGVWFVFQDGDSVVAVHGSIFSGKERVYVNGELKVDSRSFGLRSEHHIELDHTRYTVIFRVRNVLTGKVSCTLLKNDNVFQSCQLTFTNAGRWQRFVLLSTVLLTLVISAIYFVWPLWCFYTGLVLVLMIDVLTTFSSVKFEELPRDSKQLK